MWFWCTVWVHIVELTGSLHLSHHPVPPVLYTLRMLRLPSWPLERCFMCLFLEDRVLIALIFKAVRGLTAYLRGSNCSVVLCPDFRKALLVFGAVTRPVRYIRHAINVSSRSKPLQRLLWTSSHPCSLFPVQEVPHSALYRQGDDPRRQPEPDVRACRDHGWESHGRDVSHRGPHPDGRRRVSRLRQLSDRLRLVRSAPHPREQSVSHVTVNPPT